MQQVQRLRLAVGCGWNRLLSYEYCRLQASKASRRGTFDSHVSIALAGRPGNGYLPVAILPTALHSVQPMFAAASRDPLAEPVEATSTWATGCMA